MYKGNLNIIVGKINYAYFYIRGAFCNSRIGAPFDFVQIISIFA